MQKRIINISTFLRIKRTATVDPVIREISENEIEIINASSKNQKQDLTFTLDHYFSSTAMIIEVAGYFNKNKIQSFIDNNKRSLNLFFLGQNKSNKLVDLCGFYNFKSKKSEKGLIQIVSEFILQKMNTIELRVVKIVNGKKESLLSNIRSQNLFVRINSIRDVESAIETFKSHLSHKGNNFNILISIRFGKINKKLINFIRLSIDGSIKSKDKLQQIISLSDYFILQKYISLISSGAGKISIANLISKSDTLKELEFLLFSLGEQNLLDDYLFINYLNPELQDYSSMIDSMIYLNMLKNNEENLNVNFDDLRISGILQPKKINQESMNLELEYLEKLEVLNKLMKQVDKFNRNFERLTGMKVKIVDVNGHTDRIIDEIKRQTKAPSIVKLIEEDRENIKADAEDEKKELFDKHEIYDNQIRLLEAKSSMISDEIASIRISYMNLKNSNKEKEEVLRNKEMRFTDDYVKNYLKHFETKLNVLNQNIFFDDSRKAIQTYKNKRRKKIEELENKNKNKMQEIFLRYYDDRERLEKKYNDKKSVIYNELVKLERKFEKYFEDKERMIEEIQEEIDILRDLNQKMITEVIPKRKKIPSFKDLLNITLTEINKFDVSQLQIIEGMVESETEKKIGQLNNIKDSVKENHDKSNYQPDKNYYEELKTFQNKNILLQKKIYELKKDNNII